MNLTNVTSCDFVPELVAKMNERNVPGVSYAVMDFLAMSYESNSFDVILDKGSFDAICLDVDPESETKFTKYLSEQIRVLDHSAGGKFLIISLLQAHVLDALLDYFVRGKNNPHFADYVFDLELRKLDKICDVRDSKFVSFLLAFTKKPRSESETTSTLSLKLGTGIDAEVMTEDALKQRVKELQLIAIQTTEVKEFSKGQVF